MSRTLANGGKIVGYPAGNRTPSRRKRFNPGKSKLPVIFLILLLVYVTFSFGTRFNELYAMQQNVREIQEQVDRLTEKNARLRKQLEMVQSDAYVEAVAREKLGLVRAGEVRIVPVEESPKLRDPNIRD